MRTFVPSSRTPFGFASCTSPLTRNSHTTLTTFTNNYQLQHGWICYRLGLEGQSPAHMSRRPPASRLSPPHPSYVMLFVLDVALLVMRC